MPDSQGNKLVVSPGLLTLAAVCITSAGAALCGSVYLASTRKALQEEGIDLQARTRAVPLAGRALLLSSLGCAGLAGAAYMGFCFTGVQSADSVQLSSWQEASRLIQAQRELISKEFKRAMLGQKDADGSKPH